MNRRRTTKEHRESPRYPMRWKIAIVYEHTEEHPTFHGMTHEISLTGLSLLTDHNIFTEEPVTLLLAVPPKHQGTGNKLIEIRAHMVYTVHSSGHDKFRIGMHFSRFKGDGRALLDTSMKERAISVSTTD